MVISKTVITFDGSKASYSLPEEIDINPDLLLDDHEGVYRLSIGNINLSTDEAAEYEPFFNALDDRLKRDCFIQDMFIEVGTCILHVKLAYVEKVITRYGTLYEIEATVDEVEFKQKEIKDAKIKDKAVQSRRKATYANTRN